MAAITATSAVACAAPACANRRSTQVHIGRCLTGALSFSGVLFSVADAGLTWADIVDLPSHLFLASFGLDLGNPIQLGRIGSPQGVAFDLDGFLLQAGPSFQLAAAVPEPESWLLMLAGFVLVAGVARRRKRF